MNRAVSALIAIAALLLAGCGGPVAHVVVAVRDEDGSAVTNVEVGVGTFVRRIPGPEAGFAETAQVEARTDTNGFASLTIPSRRGDLYLRMRPTEGFYYDRGTELRMTNAVGGRWEPWGQTNVLVVRRIFNPIPMYARAFSDGALPVPENGNPVGFDLMEADWVAPHGHGRVADFIFTVSWRFTGHDSFGAPTWEASIELSFSNEGDGILEVPIPIFAPPRGSVFRMPREAPLHGYRPVMSWEGSRMEEYSPRIPEDMNYFFRVRTKVTDGKPATALYGKIHGPLQISIRPTKTTVKLAYYLNPIPNDRNMEFDPKRNLLKLESYQRINDP
jgi:hypothetical protein